MEQQNKYRVIVSARAAQMLVSHAAFLAQVSPAAAERLTVEFEKAAKSLEQMPQRCPWLRGEYIPKNAYRFILFEKRYMLIFQIVDNTVYADYVVDCRQDYGWLIRCSTNSFFSRFFQILSVLCRTDTILFLEYPAKIEWVIIPYDLWNMSNIVLGVLQ